MTNMLIAQVVWIGLLLKKKLAHKHKKPNKKTK